jgi:DNA-binding PadR family transcriptional regulator
MSDNELDTTSFVLLGFLAAHPRSGYDIKSHADHSTRFFWQISYGQIYPELKRLVELGLAAQQPGSRGGRTRNVYHITAKGRAALKRWLALPTTSTGFEMRDEMLLKLFFSDAAGTAVKQRILTQMQLRQEALIAELRAMEPRVKDIAASQASATKLDVLKGGIEIHQAYLDFLKGLLKNLT